DIEKAPRLSPAAMRGRKWPDRPVHEEPAKVGDTATAAGLKQVAEATAHHGPPTAPAPPRDDRHTR
ncbi:hypothetical protein ABZ690_19095, partial [Streptomyces sp. NPDC006967]